jgi:hypothetical protein
MMPCLFRRGMDGKRMRYKPPISNGMGRHITVTNRLIALGVLLCFGILMAASGPHLVHHLADRHPEPSHPQPHPSQPTVCLVLSLMQHTPLTGDFSAPLAIYLSTAEPASCGQRLQAATAPHPIAQARSPPRILHP